MHKFYLVNGGPLLSACLLYREAYMANVSPVNAYGRELGADSLVFSSDGRLIGMMFEAGKAPKAFRKPNKDGVSVPKVHSGLVEEFAKYNNPKADDVLVKLLGCPTRLHYTVDGSPGFRSLARIGELFQICWYSPAGPIMLSTHDVAARAEKVRTKFVGREVLFTDAGHEWVLCDPHCQEISLDEWEAMRAEYKESRGIVK